MEILPTYFCLLLKYKIRYFVNVDNLIICLFPIVAEESVKGSIQSIFGVNIWSNNRYYDLFTLYIIISKCLSYKRRNKSIIHWWIKSFSTGFIGLWASPSWDKFGTLTDIHPVFLLFIFILVTHLWKMFLELLDIIDDRWRNISALRLKKYKTEI